MRQMQASPDAATNTVTAATSLLLDASYNSSAGPGFMFNASMAVRLLNLTGASHTVTA